MSQSSRDLMQGGYMVILLGILLLASGCTFFAGHSMSGFSPGNQADTEWRIDRAVIAAPDLDSAAERFRAAGFTVTPGGDYAGGSIRSAIIPFEDGSCLEIIAPRDPAVARDMQQLVGNGKSDAATAGMDAFEKRFMLHFANGSGFKDFALSSPGLNLTAKRLDAGRNGAILDGPIPVPEGDSGGTVVKRYVAVPNSTFASSMPFLITDDTPRGYHVPGGNATVHPNGVTGIRDLVVTTRDPAAVMAWYDTMIPSVPRSGSGTVANYELQGTFITVYGTEQDAPEGPDTIVLVRDNGDLLSLNELGLI